ncbi:hypothetical protein BDM02DRAFT_3113215 [Thelephora ganbajun]|uniref:Uncharacterized protein n=1 Tax=Thelephora ganbajun TaxID=370292 RepID=A0ACB6ZJI9_THEGA|nr:hypothetical protein BDM02DRAFT_3113215 [Thelephora ganbajun]
MPRRPKKRSANHGKSSAPSFDPSKGKMKAWNAVDDIPLDEEDEFHANQDRILLDGDEMQYDEDDFGAEDEVFALNGVDSSSEGEGGDENQEGEEDAMEVDDGPSTSRSVKSSKAKPTKARKLSAPGSGLDQGEDESEEEETWGTKKSAYYSANDAHFDSGDEEANELEEKEARRLQMEAREGMGDEDFGLDNLQALVEDGRMEPGVIRDLVGDPVATPSLPQDKPSLLRHLEKNSPETLALARDWDDIAVTIVKAGQRLKKMESENPDATSLGMVHLHYQTLLTYATTLAFYLHLRSTPKYAAHPDLVKSHPVLERLLTLKQSLSTLEDLDFDMSDSQSGEDGVLGDDFDESDEDLEFDDEEDEEVFDLFNHTKGGKKKKPKLEVNELQELLKDAETDISDITPTLNGAVSPDKKRKAVKEPPSPSQGEEATSEPPKKRQKTDKEKNAKSSKTRPVVFDLVEPEFEYSTPKSASVPSVADVADAFGEQTVLQSFDAADKKARKKSLRFHTAKIEGTVTRRDKGTKNLMGGDDDIPYKERKKQKETREAKEIAKKGRGLGGDDLSDGDPEVDMDVDFAGLDGSFGGSKSGKKRSRNGLSEDHEDVDPGQYYSFVEESAKERREKKKAKHDAAKAAERDALTTPEAAHGPRALTSTILKNRGLTPHRSKSVRNPRVKKRQKFEKAKKKVSSQKAVYRGGIGDVANYGGEKSGISKVVKAIRL